MDNADELIMTWIQECERGMLEMAYIDLLHSYRKLKKEYSDYRSNASWEGTARQQERSGGWM